MEKKKEVTMCNNLNISRQMLEQLKKCRVKGMPMCREGGEALGNVKGTTERGTTYEIIEIWNQNMNEE